MAKMTRKEFYSYLESLFTSNYENLKYTFFNETVNGVKLNGYIFGELIRIEKKRSFRSTHVFVNIMRLSKYSDQTIKEKIFNVIDTVWFSELEFNIPADKEN